MPISRWSDTEDEGWIKIKGMGDVYMHKEMPQNHTKNLGVDRKRIFVKKMRRKINT